MHLETFCKAIQFKITAAYEPYDSPAYFPLSTEFWCRSAIPNDYSVKATASSASQQIYEIAVLDFKNQRAYLWTDPEYVDKRREFCATNQWADIAWKNIKWIEIDEESDILEKVTKIVSGVEYDTRVTVPLDIPDDVFLQIAKLAHQDDITFNKYIEKILTYLIKNDKANSVL